jgi:hypothetical protein
MTWYFWGPLHNVQNHVDRRVDTACVHGWAPNNFLGKRTQGLEGEINTPHENDCDFIHSALQGRDIGIHPEMG